MTLDSYHFRKTSGLVDPRFFSSLYDMLTIIVKLMSLVLVFSPAYQAPWAGQIYPSEHIVSEIGKKVCFFINPDEFQP